MANHPTSTKTHGIRRHSYIPLSTIEKKRTTTTYTIKLPDKVNAEKSAKRTKTIEANDDRPLTI